MFFERLVQLMIIHRVQKNYEEAAKRARLEKENEPKEESILDVFNRKMKEYSTPNDSEDYQDDDDDDNDSE